MTTTIACLWRGTDLPAYSADQYGPRYVEALRRGVVLHADSDLLMLVDQHYWPMVEELGVEARPFNGLDCGGWSRVLEAFHPFLWPRKGERILVVGLDTVFTGDASWLFSWDEAPIGLPLDPFCDPEVCDAVITANREGCGLVWNAYLESKKDGMQQDLYMGQPSEMALLRRLSAIHKWPPLETSPAKLLSYKVHLIRDERDWKDASVVYFHGPPKPADLRPADPIYRIWSNT